jgi:hypothetical protein
MSKRGAAGDTLPNAFNPASLRGPSMSMLPPSAATVPPQLRTSGLP